MADPADTVTGRANTGTGRADTVTGRANTGTGRARLGWLREGERVDGVELTGGEAAALNASGLVAVEPLAVGWRVSAGETVGAVGHGELVVRVRPNLPPLQVLRLLARATGHPGLRLPDGVVPHGLEPDGLEPHGRGLDGREPHGRGLDGRGLDGGVPGEVMSTLAMVFAREAGAALACGVARGYRTAARSLPVLRGRLNVRDQELRRFGRPGLLAVTVDEPITDTDVNRRLRAAGRRLLTLPGLPRSATDRLDRLDRLLAAVPLEVDPPGWQPARLDVRLHRLLHLADLVLALRTVEPGAGGLRGCTLCLGTLFQQLVIRLVTEAATGPGFGVSSQRPYDLDAGGRLSIRPDLLVTAGARVVAVADTRYTERFGDSDAYRLITCCARFGLDTGHVLHAGAGARPAPYDVICAGTRLIVHGIDLRQPVEELAGSVQNVFLKLVRLRPTSAIA